MTGNTLYGSLLIEEGRFVAKVEWLHKFRYVGSYSGQEGGRLIDGISKNEIELPVLV